MAKGPVYKTGYVEQELRRMAAAPNTEINSQDLRRPIALLSAAVLMLLERTEPKKRKRRAVGKGEKS